MHRCLRFGQSDDCFLETSGESCSSVGGAESISRRNLRLQAKLRCSTLDNEKPAKDNHTVTLVNGGGKNDMPLGLIDDGTNIYFPCSPMIN